MSGNQYSRLAVERRTADRLQPVGAIGRDEMLLDVAAAYERLRPWSDLRPALR
jgi:hypothetical protein